MLVFVLSIGPSELLLPSWWAAWRTQPDAAVLGASIIGLALGSLAARPVFRMSTKASSPRVAVALAVATFATLAGLIYLRESGLWPWPLAAGDALLVCACLVLVPITLVTEQIHGVKVYLGGRSLRFVRTAGDA